MSKKMADIVVEVLFSLWRQCVVFNGRGDRIINLVKGGNVVKSLLG
jgi:hypothetical protein